MSSKPPSSETKLLLHLIVIRKSIVADPTNTNNRGILLDMFRWSASVVLLGAFIKRPQLEDMRWLTKILVPRIATSAPTRRIFGRIFVGANVNNDHGRQEEEHNRAHHGFR